MKHYIQCTVCKHKKYFETKDQILSELRMIPTTNHRVICDQCFNKGELNG